MELREEDGKTILTVKPDRDWLSAEERQYPVRIDPTPVEIQKSSFNMIGVEEGSPTSQIGDNNYPYVGFDDGIKSGNLAGFGTAHQNCRTYIKVNSNFSQIPKDSKIDSATFAVSQKTAYKWWCIPVWTLSCRSVVEHLHHMENKTSKSYVSGCTECKYQQEQLYQL